MYTLTINGNTPEELYKKLEILFDERKTATIERGDTPDFKHMNSLNVLPAEPVMQTSIAPPIATIAPTSSTAPTTPTAPALNYTPPPQSVPPISPIMPTVPSAGPTYTMDALARAGAALAQSGKMTEALALLARYDVQTVNQLKPEQYGAFATELRALGAQV